MNCLYYFLFLFFLFSTFSCEFNDQVDTSNFDLDNIRRKQKLVVLVENSTLSFYENQGKYCGLEYEILNLFAKSIGIKLEIKVLTNHSEFLKCLIKGEGDIIACNRPITLNEKQSIDFSLPYYSTHQVLVQRKIADSLILRNVSDLGSKVVFVPEGSIYEEKIKQLSNEIGEKIFIKHLKSNPSSEDLMAMISGGKIDYTIVSENLANLNTKSNLYNSLVVSARQKIAFGIRKGSPQLKKALNGFLATFFLSKKFAELKSYYLNYMNPDPIIQVVKIKKGVLSPYDQIFKSAASKYGWDWKLLASVSCQESNFNPTARGGGGAFGLMQIMPKVGDYYGVYPNSSIEKQINSGMFLLDEIFESWSSIPIQVERIKFTLASYNAGKGHIDDAQRLAVKNGLNPFVWDNNVQVMTKKLADPIYYRDPCVKYGAYRGPAHYYANEVFNRYLSWK